MVNYNQSIIYKLCCRNVDITEIYVGSTTNFYRRKSQHKATCINPNGKDYNCYVYQFIRENQGWDNWDMVIVEEYSAINKNDLHKRERHWIETLKATLNKIIPTRTKKEYETINSDKVKEYQKQKYENNKDARLEKNRQYREKNKDKLKEYGKQKYENNKDAINEKARQYREKNKDKILEQKRQNRLLHKEAINEKRRQQYQLKKQLKEQPAQVQPN
jgi:hypothetical protein